jgi:SNF2 family DNA or RNA helicase
MLSAELHSKEIKHYVLTGETGDKQRAWIKREFQSDTGDMVILINTKAGGISLDLDAADDVVICDQTFIPDDQEQVEDRAHRISRMHNVTVWNLASLGTIDEAIAVLNQERGEAISSILDQQRGVTYAKALVSKLKEKRKAA